MNKKTILGIAVIALTAIVAFTACSGSGGGGKSLNSAAALKEYLDKQQANSSDQPIKVAMKANDMMLLDIAKVISEAGKYVSLDLSGSPLTTIGGFFDDDDEGVVCKTLVGIIIPNSVTSIDNWAFVQSGLTSVTIPDSVTEMGYGAFFGCTSLTSVTFQGTIASDKFYGAFDGDLDNKYLAGGIGTYTTTAPVNRNSKWTK